VVFEKIRSHVGTRYDPAVVDALVAAYEHGRIKLKMQRAVRTSAGPMTVDLPSAPVENQKVS
jgi:hypothetical protein